MMTFPLAVGALALAAGTANAQSDSIRQASLQEVVVRAVRASENAPFAVTNLKKQELNSFSKTGRELPLLFANTPGVLAWGENGLGTGTVYMRIRGAAGSRINVTLDGVPLNSPEDQTVFWANMNSYGSLLGSAQIQRGIGTSTNGDGAFGGTISLGMAAPLLKPYLEATASYGSYNTYNVGGNFSTGLIGNHLVFDGAYHHTGTDGYLHGTSGNSGSYYGGLTWLGDNFKLSYKNVGNYEHTGQAWNGVTAGNDGYSMNSKLGVKTYRDLYKMGMGRFNSLYEGFKEPEDPDEKGGWTISRYKMDDGSYWKKTTDNFVQDHNILSFTWQPSAHWTHNAAIHYTYGHGYYKEFRPNYKFAKFGIYATDASGNFVKKADFVRRKGLTQHTYGLVYNANYKDENWDVLGGVNLQQFRGNHYGYLDYISKNDAVNFQAPYEGFFTRDIMPTLKYYDSDAHKFDYSGFLKATRHLGAQWDVFADLQYRYVHYKTNGVNDKFIKQTDGTYKNQSLNIDEDYNFFNLKAGITFHENGHKAYFSVAYAGREPERNNFTDNGSYPAPKAEHLLDFEWGYNYEGRNWHAGANFYYMNYHNQFVQTGQQSDIGENLTTNVKKSYRAGVELTADWTPLPWLTLAANAALSENKIKDFDEYIETYDDEWGDVDPTVKHYDNSTLSFSPAAILNGFVTFRYHGFEGTWHTNYVSRQYMDLSANKDRSLPWFTASDVNMSYRLPLKGCLKAIVFGLNLNNIFDRHYAVSGWSYSAIVDKHYPESNRYYQLGYIPAAGFNMMGNITLQF